MTKGKILLQSLPKWMLSGICLLVILYLTLTPKPLGDQEFLLFPNADKVVHGIMFGGLLFCLCIDRWRQTDFHMPSVGFVVWNAIAVIALGGLIEILQMEMNIGRSADIWDFISDSIGVILVGITFLSLRCYDRYSR